MKYLMIDDIYIVYDDKTQKSAYELKKIVENNPLLFRETFKEQNVFSFIQGIPNSIYIDNLDTFIEKVINDNFYVESLEKRLSDPKESLIVYLGYIIVEGLTIDKIKDLYSTDKSIEETVNTLGDSLYQKEIYEDILIKEYFDEFGSKKDFIDYIKNKNNTKELIERIKDKYRFKAYNYVLNNIVNYLKECGYFEPENMLEICGNIHFDMRELTIRKIIDPEEMEKRLKGLPKLNKIKLDKYFKEFLLEINPDGTLLTIYKDALKKGKIKFNKKYNSSYCVMKDNDVYLEVKDTGTIEDFFTLSHEFMHYVINTYNRKSIPLALEEFPSIFFETYSIEFLKRKGYKEDKLEVLHDFRYNDMKEKSFGMLNFLIADIIDKSKGKEVDDKRLREYITVLNKIISKRNEDNELYIEPYDIDEYIKKDIDDRTKSYFVGLIEYVEAFRYPISAYLAFKTYDNISENKDLIEQVVNYMLYATNPTFKETIETFGIEKNYNELVENIEKQKQKTLNKKDCN